MPDLSADRMAVDLAHINGRSDAAQWRSAWRARERWYSRWERDFNAALEALNRLAETNLDGAVDLATGQVRKADDPDEEEMRRQHLREIILAILDRLLRGIREGIDAGRAGATSVYAGLGLDTGEDAGQYTLDALGLNRTFRWYGQRDFLRDELAVRGSKIIQLLYGNHLEQLARIIADATNPAEPKTVDEVRKEILERWGQLTRAEAQRIARTETGIVWERTHWYAMRANGVRQVRWVVAHGPAIGVRVGPVCPRCMALSAGSPYDMGELAEIPPAHPNCRCTLIPVLDPRWLPPAEPWTGSEAPLPTEGLSSGDAWEAGRTVPKDVQVFKAGRLWGKASGSNGWAAPRGWK